MTGGCGHINPPNPTIHWPWSFWGVFYIICRSFSVEISCTAHHSRCLIMGPTGHRPPSHPEPPPLPLPGSLHLLGQFWGSSAFVSGRALCCAKSLQSCPTLCDPTDCSPPGSSVHGILQAGILEWVAMSSSRGSARPKDRSSPEGADWMGLGLAATSVKIFFNLKQMQPNIKSE